MKTEYLVVCSLLLVTLGAVISADPVTISFSPTTYTVIEGEDSVVTLKLVRNGDLARTTVVTLTGAGTAMVGSDYVLPSKMITFQPDTFLKFFGIPIMNDGDKEPVETFTASLSTTDSDVNFVNGNATIIIIDDEATVSFDPTTYNVTEGEGVVANLSLVRDGYLNRSTVVSVLTGAGTAMAGSDYSVLDIRTVTFQPGGTEAFYEIPIVNDHEHESDETFTAMLNTTDSNVNIVDGNVTVTITDDDEAGLCVRFEQTIYQVVESKEKVEVCVITCSDIRKQGISDEVIRVIVFGEDNVQQIPRGSPLATPDVRDVFGKPMKAPGSDYPLEKEGVNYFHDNNIVINATNQRICYNQTVYDDILVEPTEYFGLTLSVISSTVQVRILPGYNTSAIRIIDDDVAVSFDPTAYTVTEGKDMVSNLRLVRYGDEAVKVVVTLTTSAGTAKAGTDYNGTVGTMITFSSGETEAFYSVPIVNDNDIESTETFTVLLSTAESNVYIGNDTAVVTIMDKDMCADLRAPRDGSVTLNGYTTGDTAVHSCNDGFELIGDVTRTCMNISKWSGEPPTCRSIVVTVSFNPTTYTVTEGKDDVVYLVVVRSGDLSRTIDVMVTTAAGTAMAGTDYNDSTITLVTFASNVTEQLHTILILNDNNREPSEKLNATLSTNQSYVNIVNDTAIVTVLDDESAKLSSPTNVILSTIFIILFFVAVIVLTTNCLIWWKKRKSKESLSPTTLTEELDIKTFSELDTKTVSSDMTQSGNMQFEMTNYACEELDEPPLSLEVQEPVN